MEALGCASYPPRDRETDRVVEFQGQYFKVECRYKSKGKLTAVEIREFTERVRTSPANCVGILATNAASTRTAPRYIERATPHQVLIMEEDDINSLISGQEGFGDFLRRKNVAAAGGVFPRSDRRILVPSRTNNSTSQLIDKPPVLLIEGKPSPYLTNHTNGPECLVFTPIWYRGSERSYVLESSPRSCETVSGLARTLEEFNLTFGVTEGAAFTLTQNQWSWHGFGVEDFLRCLRERNIRYEGVGLENFHHSETALFIDEVRMGGIRDCLFWLAAQPDTRQERIHHVYCGFMFSELPFDTRNFQQFFESVGPVPDGYDSWEGNPVKYFHLKKESKTRPLGYVLSPDSHILPRDQPEVWVQGLMVEGQKITLEKPTPDSQESPESGGWARDALSNSKMWITELQDWHPLEHRPRPQYEIGSIRVVEVPAPGFGGAIASILVHPIFN